MTRRIVARSIAVALAAGAVVTTVTATALGLVDRAGPAPLLVAVAVLVLATIGTLLAIRVPGNAIGWLLLVTAVCLGIWALGTAYWNMSVRIAAGALPGTAVAAWLYVMFNPITALNVAIPLIYPDGRLLSPRWRWLVALLVFSAVTGFAHDAFRPGPMPYSGIENPFGIAGIERLLPSTGVIGVFVAVIFAAVIFLGAIASVVIRYRRGGLVERQQLKWLIAAVALNVTAWPIVAVSGSLGLTAIYTIGAGMGLMAFGALPVAIGIAVLRYRLYEIDRIISRTIAWALVTGVLVSVFFGVVVAIQAVLTDFTQGETVAVAASTLVAAALFHPLRRRVQRAVDRRFDRATYDAQRTVATFAERLRDEVALDAVVADLEQTVADSIRPVTFALWLRPASEGRGPN
jgi:hypothetical protein